MFGLVEKQTLTCMFVFLKKQSFTCSVCFLKSKHLHDYKMYVCLLERQTSLGTTKSCMFVFVVLFEIWKRTNGDMYVCLFEKERMFV